MIANVFGYTREDYERTIQILNDGEGIAAYELNVSCPNTAHGGLQFGSDPRSLDEVVTTAKRVAKRPLIVKLSPNVTSIAQMAYVAQEAGADALSLVNTFVAMAIDPETRKPRIANVTAGLSGPAIKPIAVRMVYDASHAVKIPVIGMGGISTAADVDRVHARWSSCGADRHRQLLGPVRYRKNRRRTARMVQRAPRHEARRSHRRNATRITSATNFHESDSVLDFVS